MATAKKAAATEAFPGFSPEGFKESFEKMTGGFQDFAEFHKESTEALMASAGVYAKAVEKAATEQTTFVKESFDETAAVAKSVSSAKSFQEAVEIQSEFVRDAFEKQVAFTTKLTDHWTDAAKEATDPLAKRYGEFVELVQGFRP